MAIRMTGLISGMDTESIVTQLMDAQKLKNKRTTDKQTMLTWKQEKWKELNAKLYKLYKEDLYKVKTQGNYLSKKVTSSNENLVTVTGGTNAPVGAHNLKINQLASSQYVTSGVLADSVTTGTYLKDDPIGMTSTAGKDSVITIKNGDVERNLIVSDKTTLGDFINACKDVGLNASYDTAQKRIFISSKSSGINNNFTITTGEVSSDATVALDNIKSLVNYAGIGAAGQSAVAAALSNLEGKTEAEIGDLYTKAVDGTKGVDIKEQKAIDAFIALRNYALKKAESDASKTATKETKEEIKVSLIGTLDPAILSGYEAAVQAEVDAGTLILDTSVAQTVAQIAKERYTQKLENDAVLADLKAQVTKKLDAGTLTLPEGKNKVEFINETAQSTYDTAAQADRNKMFNTIVENKFKTTEYKAKYQEKYDNYINTYKANESTGTKELVSQVKAYVQFAVSDKIPSANLSMLKLGEITGESVTTEPITPDTTNKMTVIAAADAKITLDGADLTSSSNVITANGLTITAKGMTVAGEQISLNVNDNNQNTYDMVKNFLKSYNEILTEMNTLYDSPSTRSFDPLSDDDKEAMTDDQIEKWETKIQDSILRRDGTLGSLTSAMRTTLMGSVKVTGSDGIERSYSLASFGIQTSVNYKEKGLLHIYGDKDDSEYADKTDKLMKAIEEDPDTVMKVLAGLTGNLYDTMAEKMSAIPNTRSAFTFYNDKEMDKIQTEYKKKVTLQEEKLVEMEDRYYKQFTAMETALAKMQSQQSALAGMLGQSTN